MTFLELFGYLLLGLKMLAVVVVGWFLILTYHVPFVLVLAVLLLLI